MSLNVRIDRDRCIGSGNCVLELPWKHSRWTTEGRVSCSPAQRRLMTTGSANIAWRCPTQAIRLFDAAGAEVDSLA